MKFVCIVAEYNPLHLGHVAHLAASKSLGDATLVVMGGDFCQRGLSSVLDKYARAEHAVKAGADIVVELPTLHTVHCAEQFARGAMRLIDLLPFSTLSFGSECGDLDALSRTAILLDDPDVDRRTKELITAGIAYPRARGQAISEYSADHNISVVDVTLPNNILALEYIRAAGGRHPLFTLMRNSDYHSATRACSSSYIRDALAKGERFDDVVPDYVRLDLTAYAPPADVLYLAALRSHDKAYFEGLLDNVEGLSNRVWHAAMDNTTLSSAIETAMTKRYSRARICRLFTAALLDLRQVDFDRAQEEAPYFNVLAVRRDRTSLIGALARYADVYTTHEGLSAGPTSAIIDKRAHDVYQLLTSSKSPNAVRIVD